MDQRRQLLSALVAVTLFFGWMQVAPLLFPDWFPQPLPKNQNLAQNDKPAPKKPAADLPEVKGDPATDSQPPTPSEQPAEFPAQTITLGEAGFDAGYLLKVELNSKGSGINGVWLTDPRYTTLDRKAQVKVVGNETKRNVGFGPIPKTFATNIPEIDEALAKHNLTLDTVNWEVVKQAADSVTFRYPSPAANLEVLKTYTLPKVDLKTRDTDAAGYLLDVQLVIRNLTDHAVPTEYILQGPVGVPLENAENTRVFREIKLGTFENARSSSITSTNLLASALVKQFDKAQKPNGKAIGDWRAPLLYAGIDEQFFAALIFPRREVNGKTVSQIALTRPELLYLDRSNTNFSDMSLVMESPQLILPAKGEVVNEFRAFFGPKRPELLQQLNAESIIQLGWFAFVSKIMLIVLDFFHNSLHLPYALAIIALTVVVRLAMFPISRKQAIEAEKMKILAPKMKELQDRYKGQPEQFAKAYREFQKKHNYQPLMGCLPALLQLPIFLGLYNCLFHAVDLRLAKFLWIDNLAAPDAIAQLPFRLPFLGSELNLLPFITVILFVIQQKMFTPPPTTEEQALQYKMMNYMMIFIGFMFYHVPSGLCVYFIASSLWGICERLLLKKSLATHQEALAEAAAEEAANPSPEIVSSIPASAKKASGTEKSTSLKTPTWWDKIREAADQAKNTTEGQQTQRKFSKDKKDGGKGKKPLR